MSYSTILFDLDGTITDPFLGITKSVAYALDAYGFSHGDLDSLKSFIGPPLKEQLANYTGTDLEFGQKLLDKYREYYSVTGIFENSVYDGVPQMLQALKDSGKVVALATSKPEKFAKIILDHFDLSKYFDLCAGATMDSSRVKKADVIRYCLQTLGLSEGDGNVIMVGDRHHDIDGAKECGIKCIGVTFGYGSYEELTQSGADKIAASVEELMRELMI